MLFANAPWSGHAIRSYSLSRSPAAARAPVAVDGCSEGALRVPAFEEMDPDRMRLYARADSVAVLEDVPHVGARHADNGAPLHAQFASQASAKVPSV